MCGGQSSRKKLDSQTAAIEVLSSRLSPEKSLCVCEREMLNESKTFVILCFLHLKLKLSRTRENEPFCSGNTHTTISASLAFARF